MFEKLVFCEFGFAEMMLLLLLSENWYNGIKSFPTVLIPIEMAPDVWKDTLLEFTPMVIPGEIPPDVMDDVRVDVIACFCDAIFLCTDFLRWMFLRRCGAPTLKNSCWKA